MFIDFRETQEKRKRKRERERNIDQLPLVHALTGDQTHNLGMCSDQESNPQHFGVRDSSPTN